MGAGAGYSTELMARSVGPTGKVYGQVDEEPEKLRTRMTMPVMSNVTVLVRPSDDPVPSDLHDLDLITFYFAYHDTTYMPIDRAKMNRAMFAALKPGGILIIADHSARPEDGVSVGKTYHRIAEQTLRSEVEAAGFKFVADAGFLRHPEDTRHHQQYLYFPQSHAGGRIRAEIPKTDVRRRPKPGGARGTYAYLGDWRPAFGRLLVARAQVRCCPASQSAHGRVQLRSASTPP